MTRTTLATILLLSASPLYAGTYGWVPSDPVVVRDGPIYNPGGERPETGGDNPIWACHYLGGCRPPCPDGYVQVGTKEHLGRVWKLCGRPPVVELPPIPPVVPPVPPVPPVVPPVPPVQPVPIPAGLLLLGSALAALGGGAALKRRARW